MKKYSSASVVGATLFVMLIVSTWLASYYSAGHNPNLSVLYAMLAYGLIVPSLVGLIWGSIQTRRYNRVISAAYANGIIPVDVIAQELGRSVKSVRNILYDAIYREHLIGIVKDGIYHDLRVATYIDTKAITRSELASNYV